MTRERSMNTAFCALLLRNVKADLRKAGIKIPKITTIRYKSGNSVQYDVWRDDTGHVGWFTAYNASEAKYKYLLTLLPEEKD